MRSRRFYSTSVSRDFSVALEDSGSYLSVPAWREKRLRFDMADMGLANAFAAGIHYIRKELGIVQNMLVKGCCAYG